AHRGRAGAMTAGVAGDIDGEFRDASIAVARSVREGGGKRDHPAGGVLDDDDRMRAVEPRAHVGDRSWSGFERRDAIVDTLVVDVADYRRIGGCRRPDAHLRNATTACAAGPDRVTHPASPHHGPLLHFFSVSSSSLRGFVVAFSWAHRHGARRTSKILVGSCLVRRIPPPARSRRQSKRISAGMPRTPNAVVSRACRVSPTP